MTWTLSTYFFLILHSISYSLLAFILVPERMEGVSDSFEHLISVRQGEIVMRRIIASVILAGAALWIAPVWAASPIAGTWTVTSEGVRGHTKREATWVITESAGTYRLEFKPNAPASGPAATITAAKISLKGNELTFTATVVQAGDNYDVNYDLIVTGDALEGIGLIAGEPQHTVYVTGKRK